MVVGIYMNFSIHHIFLVSSTFPVANMMNVGHLMLSLKLNVQFTCVHFQLNVFSGISFPRFFISINFETLYELLFVALLATGMVAMVLQLQSHEMSGNVS